MLRQRSHDSWRLINEEVFNGALEDHFNRTSLHLSFTGYSRLLLDGESGMHDIQVSLLESVVSVHDAGTWVGDVDILGSLESDLIRRIQQTTSSHHEKNEKPGRQLISVESWESVLDNPYGVTEKFEDPGLRKRKKKEQTRQEGPAGIEPATSRYLTVDFSKLQSRTLPLSYKPNSLTIFRN